MGLFRQVLREENLFAGFDDAGIVDIHVLDEEPGTDAIVCQFTSLLGQLQDVIVQQKPGLVLGVGCPVARAAGPVLRIMVMFGFRHSVFDRFDGDTGLEPSPHGYFAPVQRSLLHNGKRAIGIFAFPSHHQVGLVGCVAQEIAAEDGGRIVGQRLLDNCRVGPLDILKLSGKRQSPVRNSKQDVIFGNPAFPGKSRNLNFDSFVCICLFDIIHVVCAFLFFSSVIDPIVEQRQGAGRCDDVGMIVFDNVFVQDDV